MKMGKMIFWTFIFLVFAGFSQDQADKLAQKPPMGWNSWDCLGMDVTEDQVKEAADYMAAHLKKFGWQYIVLDMGWNYGEGLTTNNFRMQNPPQCIDSYGRLIPNVRKFPSSANGNGLKDLAAYVHSKGLKFGIHIVRGIPWQAVEKNTPVRGTGFHARDFATHENKCKWFHGLLSVDVTRPGGKEYYNSLIEMYSDWGVDYIKADDMMNPYMSGEIEAIHNAIMKTGRPIVLSLSAGPLSVGHTEHLTKNANLWRISGDMWDDWQYIEEAFELARQWQNQAQEGHWPDLDMLPVGRLRINGTDGLLADRIEKPPLETVNELSRFTTDEKYTLMTLWSVFRSPLMIGGYLPDLDSLTFSMLTNDEVLAVNQKSTDNHEIRAGDDEIVWVARESGTGALYAALFNTGSIGKSIKIAWEELGISDEYMVRDLWNHQNIGVYDRMFEAKIPPHGCRFLKFTRTNK